MPSHTVPSHPNAAVAERVECMLQAADAAGAVALRYFQTPGLTVESKGEAGPVTQADREAEQCIRKAVSSRFAHDGFLGEEFGSQPGTSEFTWVIDPIDGTVSFAAGVPLFGTLIGLEQRFPDGSHKVVAGVCAMPALHERVWAVQGGGAWWERKDMPRVQAHLHAPVELKDAMVCTPGSEYFRRSNRMHVLSRLEHLTGRMRGWSDCYGLLLLATGRCHVAVDPVMNPWDCGPFPVIIEEAGGVFTNWTGKPGIHGGDSLACHPSMHAAMLSLLAD